MMIRNIMETHLSYNDEGQLEYFGNIQFTYDQYGNRLKKGNDEYNYERGKLLSSLTINNNTTTFKYDYLGRRYQKISGGVTTTYYYHDDKLIAETRSNGIKLIFLYRDNEIVGFCKCESSEESFFYYIKNPFGLIVGIINESDQVLASYVYDAWGNHTLLDPYNYQSDIGEINPIRYKGYYYDEETKLYYLKSRYYDSSVGQFISPDDYSYLKINNVSGYYLYAYCNNNPVMYVDEDGHSAFAVALLFGALMGAAFGFGANLGQQLISSNGDWNSINWGAAIGQGILGAAFGSATILGGAAGICAIGGSVAGYALSFEASLALSIGLTSSASMLSYSLSSIKTNNWDLQTMIRFGMQGAAQGAVSFYTSYYAGMHGLLFKTFNNEIGWFSNYGTLSNIFNYSKSAIFKTASKFAFVTLPNTFLRMAIDWLIPDEDYF